MKKYFVISAFLCGIMMLFNSCSKSAINMAVDALNTGCPKQVNDIVVMDSATYQNNVITINYTVDDALVSYVVCPYCGSYIEIVEAKPSELKAKENGLQED